jgi:hypothetical protein
MIVGFLLHWIFTTLDFYYMIFFLLSMRKHINPDHEEEEKEDTYFL